MKFAFIEQNHLEIFPHGMVCGPQISPKFLQNKYSKKAKQGPILLYLF